jgi:hypothetical protein
MWIFSWFWSVVFVDFPSILGLFLLLWAVGCRLGSWAVFICLYFSILAVVLNVFFHSFYLFFVLTPRLAGSVFAPLFFVPAKRERCFYC